MNSLLMDIAYALRLFRRRPGFTAAALITLALGVGMNVAIFSAVRVVLIQDLPFPQPSQLVHVSLRTAREPAGGLVPSIATFEFLRTNSRVLRLMAVAHQTEATMSGTGVAERIRATEVSVAMMDVLGLPPVAGRGFVAEDFSNETDAMLISDRLWQSTFGRDPNAIGRVMRLNNVPKTIVGVMPNAFDIGAIQWNERSDAWLPLIWRDGKGSIGSTIIARLPTDLDPDAAAREVDRLVPELPDSSKTSILGVALSPYARRTVMFAKPGLILLQAAAALLLLIACTNLGNLLLAQASSRRRELGVRAALGAGRRRIVRQLLTEVTLLASLGAAGGVVVAYLVGPALVRSAAWALPRAHEVSVRWPEFAAAVGFAFIAALVAGVVPAFSASRRDVIDGLRTSPSLTSNRATRIFRSGLVSAQVLLAVVLLTMAGLLINSFARVAMIPMGFVTRNLVVADVALTSREYLDADRFGVLLKSLEEELAGRLPGTTVTLGTSMPYASRYMGPALPLGPDGRYARFASAPYADVTPAYFETLGIPLLRGRPFRSDDVQSSERVVIASESFAREYGPPGEIVGTRMKLGPREVTVVGVAGDTRNFDVTKPPEPVLYSPFAQRSPRSFTVAVRGASVATVRLALRDALGRIAPDLAAGAIEPIDNRIRVSQAQRRFYLLTLSLFAALGVVLACAGVFSVTAQMVGLRARELGVRLALGSTAAGLNRLVVRQGLLPVAIGLLGGFMGAWWATESLKALPAFSSQLYQIRPHDPVTIVATLFVLFAVGALACWIPARRAGRVDPVSVLRTE